MFVNLTCITQTSVYYKQQLDPRKFGLDRFHCSKTDNEIKFT